MDANSDFLAGMRSHFKQWDEAVGVLSAEGRKADGEARTAYQRRLKELRLARSAAQRCFEALGSASGAAAARSQAGLEEAWEAMQQALLRVTTDLHAPPRDPHPIPGPATAPDNGADLETAPPIAAPIESVTAPTQAAIS